VPQSPRVSLGELGQVSERFLGEGKTLIFVAADGRPAGLVAAADIVRPTAAATIVELKAARDRAGDDDPR
jgi:cation transport ATPase